jgi:hypothetical protein
MMNQIYCRRKRWWPNRRTVLSLAARTDKIEQFEPNKSSKKLQDSVSQTFFACGCLLCSKNNHGSTHVIIQCLDDRYTKLIYIYIHIYYFMMHGTMNLKIYIKMYIRTTLIRTSSIYNNILHHLALLKMTVVHFMSTGTF